MKKPRILSIDDEVNFTDFLKQYFEPRGYRIDVTSEGEKGLELLRENKCDVVLLDLRMAGLDGEEVMHELKKIDSGIKTIFITAYSDSGITKARLLQEGAYAFIEKPVLNLKELEDLVNKAANADK
jgi:DNA-binding NtrC family response regulator